MHGGYMMDKNDFKRELKRLHLHVPPYYYNIDGKGRDDVRYCLIKVNDKWNVYYLERGLKTINEFFDSESDGLEYILDVFKKGERK